MGLRLKRLYKRVGTPVFEALAVVAKKFSSTVYKGLFKAEWIVDNPENFDHEIDLYWQWGRFCVPYWLERGVYSIQALKMFDSPVAVELCCGDGFNAKHFYSTSAVKVLACDFDREIIKTARRKNQRKNIIFKVADIRDGIGNIFRVKGVTNVIWDAAIEHFTLPEIDSILKDIKQTLSREGGVLSGYTIVERREGKSLAQHEHEFKNMEDLYRLLKPYFKKVYVFETVYSDRHNLYFYASDKSVPFGTDWEHGRMGE